MSSWNLLGQISDPDSDQKIRIRAVEKIDTKQRLCCDVSWQSGATNNSIEICSGGYLRDQNNKQKI
jgi:hypothetical protein